MLISLSWLGKYVEIPVDARTLAHDLTMTGVNVERLLPAGLSGEGIVVGKVLEVASHPKADKLRLCRVMVGEGEVKQIVCGALNVAAGQMVPVALPGSRLPDGIRIGRSKIRGVISEGMICSSKELGIGADAEGILVLEENLEPGEPVGKTLSRPESVLDIEVTPNRPDLLCHLGVAREVAAIYRKTLKYPGRLLPEGAPSKGSPGLRVIDRRDCPRYVGRVIHGVKVAPSPGWLSLLLESVGVKSVNNIVDITNYVMLELGQPLHAFDLHKLKGPEVTVRRAERGEVILALDGENYELYEQFLVIADAGGPVALAGVIGGLESSVEVGTAEILLESACFHPVLVRKARKALGLSTEASYRFERQADREICRTASDRACELIVEIAGGRPGELIDIYAERHTATRITLRQRSIEKILGIRIPIQEAWELLARLGFKRVGGSGEVVEVEVPSFRPDVEEEADLIEEVARTYGYNRIGKGWNFRCTTFARGDPFDNFLESLTDHMVSRGFYEVLTSSFSDGKERNAFGWPESDPRRELIQIQNPLSSRQKYLRTCILPGMLLVLRKNMDHGVKRMRIFQIGKIFLGRPGEKGLPEEKYLLTFVLTNPDSTDFWIDSRKLSDLFDIKREVEVLAGAFKVDIRHGFCYAFDRDTGIFTYSKKEENIIEGGIVSDKIAKFYDIDQPVWYASLDIESFYRNRSLSMRLKPLPDFPVSKRDLSLVAKEGVNFQQIEKSLVKSGGRLLESVQVFDVYRGENLPKGTTAYGIRLMFRAKDKTLRDEEINRIIERILSKLRNELGVELRS